MELINVGTGTARAWRDARERPRIAPEVLDHWDDLVELVGLRPRHLDVGLDVAGLKGDRAGRGSPI
jgi:hypothetical protein